MVWSFGLVWFGLGGAVGSSGVKFSYNDGSFLAETGSNLLWAFTSPHICLMQKEIEIKFFLFLRLELSRLEA